MRGKISHSAPFYRKLRRISYKKSAPQDSILLNRKKWGDAKCEVSRKSVCRIGLILISTYIIIEIYAQKTGVLRTHRKSCAGRERKSHGEHMEQSD